MAEYAWDERPVIDEIKNFDEEVFVPALKEIIERKNIDEKKDIQWVFIDTLDVRQTKTFSYIYFMHSREMNLFTQKVFARLKSGGARNQSRGMLKIRKDDLVDLYNKKLSKIK